jgi:hypothetical protein
MGLMLTFFVGLLTWAADTVSLPLYCLDGSDVRPATSGTATPYDSCKALLPGCSTAVSGRIDPIVAGPQASPPVLSTFLKDQLKDQIALYIAGLYNGYQIDPSKTVVSTGAGGVKEVKPTGAKKFSERVCSVVGWDYDAFRNNISSAELETEKVTGLAHPCGKPPVIRSDDEQKDIQVKIGQEGGGRVSAYLNGAFVFAIKRMLAETISKIDSATASGATGSIDIASECAPDLESVKTVHKNVGLTLAEMSAASMSSCGIQTQLGSSALCGQPTDVLGQNLVPLCALKNSVQAAHSGMVNALSCHTIAGARKIYDYFFRSLMTDGRDQSAPEIPSYVRDVILEAKKAEGDRNGTRDPPPALYLQAAFLRDALFYEAGKNSTTRVRGDKGSAGSSIANIFRFRQRKAACWGAAVLALPSGTVKKDDYWLIIPRPEVEDNSLEDPDASSVDDAKFICKAKRIGDSENRSDVALGIYMGDDRWKEDKGERQRKIIQDKNYSKVDSIRAGSNGKFSRNNGLLGIVERQVMAMCALSNASKKSSSAANHCENFPYPWSDFKAKYGNYRWLAP